MHGFLKSKAFRTRFLHKKSTGVKGYAGEIILINGDVPQIVVKAPGTATTICLLFEGPDSTHSSHHQSILNTSDARISRDSSRNIPPHQPDDTTNNIQYREWN
jgi:hypothetical protein